MSSTNESGELNEGELQAEFRVKYGRYWQECVRFVNDRHFLNQTYADDVVTSAIDGCVVKESRVPFAELYLRQVDKPPKFEPPAPVSNEPPDTNK